MAREADASPEIARERARQLEEKLLEIKGQLAHAVGRVGISRKIRVSITERGRPRQGRERIASLAVPGLGIEIAIVARPGLTDVLTVHGNLG